MADDRDPALNLCLICHQRDPDAPAPCNSSALCFHKSCLKMARAMQVERNLPVRCPHCNLALNSGTQDDTKPAVIELILYTMRSILQRWFQKRETGYWIQPPELVYIKDSFIDSSMHHHMCFELKVGILQFLLESFTCSDSLDLLQQCPSQTLITRKEDNLQLLFIQDSPPNKIHGGQDTAWICHCIDAANNIKITLGISRLAVIDSMGRFIQDGYNIFGQQTRFVSRRRMCL